VPCAHTPPGPCRPKCTPTSLLPRRPDPQKAPSSSLLPRCTRSGSTPIQTSYVKGLHPHHKRIRSRRRDTPSFETLRHHTQRPQCRRLETSHAPEPGPTSTIE